MTSSPGVEIGDDLVSDVVPGRERLRRLSLEDCRETAPLPGLGEGLTSRRV